jgi:hypothetical protein
MNMSISAWRIAYSLMLSTTDSWDLGGKFQLLEASGTTDLQVTAESDVEKRIWRGRHFLKRVLARQTILSNWPATPP